MKLKDMDRVITEEVLRRCRRLRFSELVAKVGEVNWTADRVEEL